MHDKPKSTLKRDHSIYFELFSIMYIQRERIYDDKVIKRLQDMMLVLLFL